MVNRLSENSQSNTLQSQLRIITLLILTLATTLILVSNAPSSDLYTNYADKVAVYIFLTALALFLAVLLSDGELSAAHVIGMMGFLAVPEEAMPIMLWGVFAGGVAGGITLYIRSQIQPNTFQNDNWQRIIYATARVTISFMVAGKLYISAGGNLPLSANTEQLSATIPLIIYCFAYVTLYFAIFLLETYITGRNIRELIQNDVWRIAVVLILPIPFALLGAEVSTQLSTFSEIVNWTGLTMIILGLYLLSYSEFRVRKQFNELRTVSVVSRAMRANLNMDALLKTVYLQIAHLLDTNNFTVVLRNLDENKLEFPLVMQQGQEDLSDPDTREDRYKDGLIETVLESGTPLLIKNNVNETAKERNLKPPVNASQSWLGVPLMAGGRSIGAMVATSTVPNKHFTRNDLRLLNIIGGSASTAIENAQLYRQQTERLDQLAALNSIGALLSGTLSPDNVVDTIITSASAISQANAVTIYLLWEDSISSMRTAGLSDNFASSAPSPMMLQDSSNPFNQRQPIAVPDIEQDKHDNSMFEAIKREGMRSFVELPLVSGNDVYGVIVLYFKQTQIYSGEKLELFRSFAAQASQAIKNANIYTTTDKAFQRSVEQLLTLAGIGRILTSTIDLTQIAELILTHATEATQITAGTVMFYDNDHTLKIMAQAGYLQADVSVDKLTEGGVGKLIQSSKETQRIDDLRTVTGYTPIIASTRSQLGVPIRQTDTVLGYIILECDRVKGFSEEDSRFVEQIANQAIIAIDNARLFERITEARDRLQVILDTMDEAIILVDAKGKIVIANPRISMLHLKPSAITKQPLATLMLDDTINFKDKLGFETNNDIQSLLDDLENPESWGNYSPTLYSLKKDGSTQYIQRYIVPVKDESNQVMGALLVFRNKTEEQELENAREQLSRMIVHDLRSPLTAVTTSLKLLDDLTPADNEIRNIVEKTTDASRRAVRKLLSRVDSLLDISKMESGRMNLDTEVGELATIADSVCVELSPLAHELEVTITSEVTEDLPLLNIDEDKVERLLLNLVDNALKYSPANGSINIRAFAHEENPDFVQVEVVDQGPGVPDDYKLSLFEKFVQVEGRKKVRRGVGLGLTFCKLVTEAHGGKIWIEDNTGGGSRFIFTLPIAKASLFPEDDELPVIS